MPSAQFRLNKNQRAEIGTMLKSGVPIPDVIKKFTGLTESYLKRWGPKHGWAGFAAEGGEGGTAVTATTGVKRGNRRGRMAAGRAAKTALADTDTVNIRDVLAMNTRYEHIIAMQSLELSMYREQFGVLSPIVGGRQSGRSN